ncbi:hypothetical protein [Ornithinicoccus hortensis]|uniref:hypothetical protein n=1 Tax=Ornithinicoccus hortensis TaxID=82346 RepID=UPI001E55C334|nr:hypothetical protein [Ornithinicoccus hortensis]
MSLTHRPRAFRPLVAALCSAALVLTACSSADDAESEDTSPEEVATDGDDGTDDSQESADDATGEDDAADDAAGEWPRTIEHESGTTEIPEEPTVVVSTSITLTGTLLAIDAPVSASAATGTGPLTDDQGFFAQWADVADERGVEVLYPTWRWTSRRSRRWSPT